MAEEPTPTWRNALDFVIDTISAEHFHEELPWLREEYEDDPDDVGAAYTAILAEWFVESAGLFATLEMPPEEVPTALADIHETLANLDFDREREQVREDERVYYERFATMAAPLFAELGEAMETLFNCYVAGEYDPDADPNELMVEALQSVAFTGEDEDEIEGDLAHAHHLINQAGAIALHSRPLWWRWQAEAHGPARLRLVTIANLVEDCTMGGQALLGPPEQARADAEAMWRECKEKREDVETGAGEEPEETAAARSPVDDLIEELIEQGDARFAPEQVGLCQTHREEAIPALIDLATDEYLQVEDAPGGGYAPIRAVELLGELKAAEAVPALIDTVADTDYMAIIYSAAINALENIGPPALEQLLDFLHYSYDTDAKTALVGAVAEAGYDDERTYEALVQLWEEATWDEGKALLAYHLADIGGEQVIPMLEAALEDPDLDWVDYNEVTAALADLDIEVPAGSAPPSPLDPVVDSFDPENIVKQLLSETAEPEYMMALVEATPEELRSYPDTLAHIYADAQRDKLNHLIAIQSITLPPEVSTALAVAMLQAVHSISFDASTEDYVRWLRDAYSHLAECAGLDFQLHIAGALLALDYYLSEDYDIADDPNELLAAARGLSPEYTAASSLLGNEELQRLFGQAGALVLHGRPLWPRWPVETDYPLSGWLEGLIEFCHPLERIGQIPLRPSPEVDPGELSALLTQAQTETEEEPPQPVTELLDLLIAQGRGTLAPAQRRRFAHQRAAVIPHLIRIVEDKQYWYEDGPGGGWAAILAARLLGELKAAQASDALVSAVADSTPRDVIHDAATFSLMSIGRPALPAVRAYFRYGRAIETKASLAEVLGRIGRQRPDTFNILRQTWRMADWTQNRRMVALAFGDLRDRRAISLLQSALDDRSADALDKDYVRWALQRLGAQAPAPRTRRSLRLKTPAPHNARLIYDESDAAHRLRYTPWGEPLCPDCGKPLVLDENGSWIHPPE